MRHTVLFDEYKAYEGIKMVDFGGWELPLHFSGVSEVSGSGSEKRNEEKVSRESAVATFRDSCLARTRSYRRLRAYYGRSVGWSAYGDLR